MKFQTLFFLEEKIKVCPDIFLVQIMKKYDFFSPKI